MAYIQYQHFSELSGNWSNFGGTVGGRTLYSKPTIFLAALHPYIFGPIVGKNVFFPFNTPLRWHFTAPRSKLLLALDCGESRARSAAFLRRLAVSVGLSAEPGEATV